MAKPIAQRIAQIDQAHEAGLITDAQRRQIENSDKRVIQPYARQAQAIADEHMAQVREHNSTVEDRYEELEKRLRSLRSRAALATDTNEINELRKELQTLHREELGLDRQCGQYAEIAETAKYIKENPIAFWDDLIDNYSPAVAEQLSPRWEVDHLGRKPQADIQNMMGDPLAAQHFVKSARPDSNGRPTHVTHFV